MGSALFGFAMMFCLATTGMAQASEGPRADAPDPLEQLRQIQRDLSAQTPFLEGPDAAPLNPPGDARPPPRGAGAAAVPQGGAPQSQADADARLLGPGQALRNLSIQNRTEQQIIQNRADTMLQQRALQNQIQLNRLPLP